MREAVCRGSIETRKIRTVDKEDSKDIPLRRQAGWPLSGTDQSHSQSYGQCQARSRCALLESELGLVSSALKNEDAHQEGGWLPDVGAVRPAYGL
jgi:hypothetical protein